MTGVVRRNHFGALLEAAAQYYVCSDAVNAEALAVRDGLLTAHRRGWNKVQIELDSKMGFEAICGSIPTPWLIRGILEDISFL